MFVFMAIAALAGVVDSTLIKPPESVQIAIPKVSQRPVLDGKLDDPAWQQAARTGPLTVTAGQPAGVAQG